MARVVWTSTAREDLKAIVEYIAANSAMYARSFALRLRRSVSRLTDYPMSGRTVPENPSGVYREIIVGNFRVIYRIEGESVLIVAVLHGARQFPSSLK